MSIRESARDDQLVACLPPLTNLCRCEHVLQRRDRRFVRGWQQQACLAQARDVAACKRREDTHDACCEQFHVARSSRQDNQSKTGLNTIVPCRTVEVAQLLARLHDLDEVPVNAKTVVKRTTAPACAQLARTDEILDARA